MKLRLPRVAATYCRLVAVHDFTCYFSRVCDEPSVASTIDDRLSIAWRCSGRMSVQSNPWQWVPLAYLHDLLNIGEDPEQASFFRRLSHLTGNSDLNARKALESYASLIHDTLLAISEELVSNVAAQANVGAQNSDELLACIIVTLFLRPGDPIGGRIYEETPEVLRSQIDGARRNVLKHLRAVLLARDDLAFVSTCRLGDVEGHGAERVGVKVLSHYARESLFFSLLAQLSGRNNEIDPGSMISEFRNAIQPLTARLGVSPPKSLHDLTAPPSSLPSSHSALFQALRIPVLTDLKFLEQTELAAAQDHSAIEAAHLDPENQRPIDLASQLRRMTKELKTLDSQARQLNGATGREADWIQRRIDQLETDIAGHRALLARYRKSKPLEAARDQVRNYYPVLMKVLHQLNDADQSMTIAGQSLAANDFFRLCFAAQRISFLCGQRYTHATRAQMVHDLSRVFEPTNDPQTGNALSAFERFSETPAKELFGPAHQRLLKRIVEDVVSNFRGSQEDERTREAVKGVRKALDDCADVGLDQLAPSSPALIDLKDPKIILNLYQMTLHLRYLLQRKGPRGNPQTAAVLEGLETNLNELATSQFTAVMDALVAELRQAWPHPLPKGPWTKSQTAALERAFESHWETYSAEMGAAGIMGNPGLRRQFFLTAVVQQLINTRAADSAGNGIATQEIDPGRVTRFFTQTFKPNVESGKRNWPRDEWEHLAQRLVQVIPEYRELDQRVGIVFASARLSGPRALYQELLQSTVEGVPFLSYFSHAVIRCLDGSNNQNGPPL